MTLFMVAAAETSKSNMIFIGRFYAKTGSIEFDCWDYAKICIIILLVYKKGVFMSP
jgi:hypothetical protein